MNDTKRWLHESFRSTQDIDTIWRVFEFESIFRFRRQFFFNKHRQSIPSFLAPVTKELGEANGISRFEKRGFEDLFPGETQRR